MELLAAQGPTQGPTSPRRDAELANRERCEPTAPTDYERSEPCRLMGPHRSTSIDSYWTCLIFFQTLPPTSTSANSWISASYRFERFFQSSRAFARFESLLDRINRINTPAVLSTE